MILRVTRSDPAATDFRDEAASQGRRHKDENAMLLAPDDVVWNAPGEESLEPRWSQGGDGDTNAVGGHLPRMHPGMNGGVC